MAFSNNFRSHMLWDNIKKGDLSGVVSLLENGAMNLEERDNNGQTFLMVACQHKEISIVRELIEAGIDPNATDNDNWTALLYAAKDGHLEITIELLERGAQIEHRDLCHWTALMWASYKGHETVVHELLDKGADPNVRADHNMSSLGWAAGRGHAGVVKLLLAKGARVNSTDKYGTTALIWACRKGCLAIVNDLLENGASVDTTGMDSLTGLLVATKGGHTEIVQALLEHDPMVNALDKDGFTALTIAAKEGYEDIVQELLAKDAYVSIVDRAGDTILIHAVKGGYTNIVRSLLNRYADVDVEGADRKTALYWAVEKGHDDIVRLLLDNDADTEICTKDGDTPLMRAVRNRNELMVRLLLDKGAKVALYDKKGDTALHISLRARSKRITELLLRNPRNSRLLYRANKSGETPYNIDAYHQKGILTQIHGHRQLNASDGENLLGYEIYSSSLADILSEPSLNTPITVGLYAKWGSGKSFLIGKLQNEMRAFTNANEENQFHFTWSLFIFLLIINCIIGSVIALTTLANLSFMWQVGLGVGFGLFVLEYMFLGLIWVCTTKYNFKFSSRIGQEIAKRLQIMTLLLQVLFCNPVIRKSSTTDVPLVKFLFSESTKLSSVGGEKALAHMIAGLSESLEKEFGLITSRMFGVFKPVSDKTYLGHFKTVCCVPIFVVVIILLLCFITGIALFVTNRNVKDKIIDGITYGFASIVGLSILTNLRNFGRAVISLIFSQRTRIMKAADSVHRIKLDGFMQVLKKEVILMNNLVASMDKFTKNTTRLVVVVDGLDSCEQEKVLQVLDIIHALFSDENSSFVVILAVDPQIIIKGIDQNLKSAFHDTNINGFDYLRNIVHLPFYLQSQGIQVKKEDLAKSVSSFEVNHESPVHSNKMYRHKESDVSWVSGFTLFEPQPLYQHQESTVSQISGYTVVEPSFKKSHYRPHADSLTQATQSNFDISNTLTKNDYFSDINPKSMRRLMNIVAVTGRLLRAYNIDFNWYRLAAWVNLVEQWPYRLSWIILYFEEHDDLGDDVTLKFIYDKIESQIPISSEVEPLLEIDRNVRKLQAFLGSKSSSSPMLNISDLKKFLPCTINLDPYLRKLIKNLQQHSELPPGMYSSPLATGGGPGSSFEDIGKYSYRANGRTPIMQPMGIMHSAPMMPYGPMGMIYSPVMGMPPQRFGMSPYVIDNMRTSVPRSTGYEPIGKKSLNPGRYITGYKNEKLSQMSTSEVMALLSHLQGVNIQQVPVYQQAVNDNNINGLVLSQCDLEDLKQCLVMKFGDWQLFKSAIQELKEVEEFGEVGSAVAADTERNEPNGSNSKRPSGNENQEKCIYFNSSSNSVNSVSSEDIVEPTTRIRGSFKRQLSIGTLREDAADGKPVFEAIHEEEEHSNDPSLYSERPGRMPRNDSVVAQMMYETGLLRNVMQSFTEDASEEEEDEEDIRNEDKIELIKNDESKGLKSMLETQPAENKTVQFSLSRKQNKSFQSVPFNSVQNEEDMEPLIDKNKSETLNSPLPLLKLPLSSSSPPPQRNSLSNIDCHSIPDFMDMGVVVHVDEQDDIPLLQHSKTGSTSSSGFTDLHTFQSNESLDLLSVVDETKSCNNGSPGCNTSLEDGIQKFMLTEINREGKLGQQKSFHASQRDVSVIKMKTISVDGNVPESFV